MPNPDDYLAIAVSSDTKRRFGNLPAGTLRHPANWLRGQGDIDALMALARSYLERPVNYIIVNSDNEVMDGNRRLEGILSAFGPDQPVPVLITDEELTPLLMLEAQLDTAAHTKALTPYEEYLGFMEWLRLTGKTASELAVMRHRSEGMVSRILSLSKALPEVGEAARNNEIGPEAWSAIVRAPDQIAALQLKRSGVPAKALATRSKAVNPVRAAKIKCKLPAGVVTLAGESLSLDDAVELLGELLKHMKKAIAQGLDAKTFQAVLSDMNGN